MGCVPFTGARRPLIDQQAQRLLAGRDAARRRLEIAALSLRLSGLDPPLGDADAGEVRDLTTIGKRLESPKRKPSGRSATVACVAASGMRRPGWSPDFRSWFVLCPALAQMIVDATATIQAGSATHHPQDLIQQKLASRLCGKRRENPTTHASRDLWGCGPWSTW